MSGGRASVPGDGEAGEPREIPVLERIEQPMHNQVILRHFFQLAPTDLLATCRLVCKAWNHLATRDWRAKAKLNFEYQYQPFVIPEEDLAEWDNIEDVDDDLIDLLGGADSDEDSVEDTDSDSESEDEADQWQPDPEDPERFGLNQQIREYLDYVDDAATNHYDRAPHRQFHLRSWRFTANWVQRFWNSVGIHVTTLTLDSCNFSGVEEFRQIIYSSCPNLRNLDYNMCHFFEIDHDNLVEDREYSEPAHGEHKCLKNLVICLLQDDNYQLPVSWLEFLSHFPSLTSLEVDYLDGMVQSPVTWNILQAINKIHRHDRQKLQLRNVEIEADRHAISNDPHSFEVFELFQRFGIPLKHLHIELNPAVEGGVITGILEPHATTLTTIDIKGSAGTKFPFGVQPQWFENVTILDLPGSLLENLNFLEFMPNLEYLIIKDETLELNELQYKNTHIVANTSKEGLENVKLLNLDHLIFTYRMSDNDLKFLCKLLPNVMFLRMVLNNEQFSTVCEQWTSLRWLSIHGDGLTEEGIIGRTISDSDQDLNGEHEKETRPSIASLQNLKSVTFLDVNVTRGIVVHGLLRIQGLAYFDSYRGTQIGDEERKMLEANNIRLMP